MTEALVVAHLLVLSRIAAFVAFFPALGGRNTPTTVKIGLAVGLTILLAPLYAGSISLSLIQSGGANHWLSIGLLVLRESFLGAALAWMLGLILVPARVAGAYIVQEMGLTMGALASPLDDQSTNPLSQGFEALAVMLMFLLNVHHFLLATIGFSFRSRPVAGTWSLPSIQAAVTAVSQVEAQGLMAIGPIVVVLFVSLVVLALTIRLSPHFNFMSWGMTVRIVSGMVALVVFFPDVLAALKYFLLRVDTLGGLSG